MVWISAVNFGLPKVFPIAQPLSCVQRMLAYMTKIFLSLRRMTRLSAIVPLAAIVLNASVASAQLLGSAQKFAVLGASTVTNNGATIITGDVGVSPGTAITGFVAPPSNVIAGPGTVTAGPGLVNGTIRPGGAVAAQAHADAVLAYVRLAGLACPSINNLSGSVLGDLGVVSSLPPGVYCFDTSAQLTGTLTLTGAGPWIFQVGTTLTTASNSKIVVDTGQTCSGSNVFWNVGSSATLGTGTVFAGNILALASITVTTGVSVSGSAIALTAAVTMDTNNISVCSSGSGGLPPVADKCEANHDKDGDDHDKDKGKDNDKDYKDKDKDKDHKDNDSKDKDHESKDTKRG